MRKNYLTKPNVNKKTIEVKDLSKVTDYAEGLIVGEMLKSTDLGVKKLYNVDLMIQDAFVVDDKTFVRTYDGILYEQRGSRFYEKGNYGYLPAKMGSVILNGQKEFLFMDSNGGKIIDDNEVNVTIPYGKHFATYALRCFSAKDYDLYFSSPFDFENRSMSLDNGGNISFSSHDGSIVGIFDFSSYLLIVCQHCFYKLTDVDGEFKLEKIVDNFFSIAPHSLAQMKDKLVFIADKKLYVYQDFVIKQKDCPFEKDIPENLSPVMNNGKFYYCALNNVDKKSTLVYDVDSGESMLVHIENNMLLYKNVLFNYEEQSLYAITPNQAKNIKWQSLAMNFGNNDKKLLIELSIKVTKSAMIKISGDFGSASFALKEGINKKNMNLYSKEYAFEIEGNSGDTLISDLQLKYIV